jgi:sterol desaturase/sphingolipid hydroxylase (fatty acid hydroxylase superfamily)
MKTNEVKSGWPWFGFFHPALPLALWGPAAITCIAWGAVSHSLDWSATAAIGAAALGLWSLIEYLLHRFLLHPSGRLKFLSQWAQFAHGVHHDAQDEAVHTLVPPVNAMLILMPFLALFYWLVPEWALAVFIGFFLAGYLAYEYIHYTLHQSDPKSHLGKAIRRHHLTHHAHGNAGNFGVSTPLWDYLLGTRLSG